MKKTHHDVLLRLVKLADILLMTGVFTAGWLGYYVKRLAVPYYKNGNYLVVAIFMILFITFANIYEAFDISMKRISEMIYSQCLAALAADGVMFLITWLLTKKSLIWSL